MQTFTETILPVLFTALTIYFIGSVLRLFIHLLIPEQCNK